MNHVFDSIKIDGYRGLTEFNISNLGQINIFVGPNNSGKTSLIEAISILCNPLDPFQWLAVAQRRSYLGISGRGLMGKPNLEGLKWVFAHKQDSLASLISISAKGNTPILGVEAELIEIYGINGENINTDESRDYEIYPDESQDSETYPDVLLAASEYILDGIELAVVAHSELQLNLFGQEEKKQTFQFWENERFVARKRHQSFVKATTIYPGYASSENIGLLRKISLIFKDEYRKNQVLEMMRWFDKKINDIQILSPPTSMAALYIKHQDLGWTPLYIFGEGLKRALLMAVTLMSIENRVLLIDEIETSIHNSALSPVFSWLVDACHRLQVQLFVTTHSLEAIDAMLQAEMSTDNIVAFRLSASGESPQRFTGNLLHRLRYERGLDIRG